MTDVYAVLKEEEGENDAAFTMAYIKNACASMGFDRQATLDSFREIRSWRKRNQLDVASAASPERSGFLDARPVMSAQLAQLWAGGIHGHSKQGQPVVYDRVGLIQFGGWAHDVSEGEMARHHTWRCEQMVHALKGASERAGRPIDRYLWVADLNGMNMNIYKSLAMTKVVAAISQNYYPGRLAGLLVLRAPWIFGAIFPVVKMWLDPITVEKISIQAHCKELFKRVDKDQIPWEYGGDCRCKGDAPCIPKFPFPVLSAKDLEAIRALDPQGAADRFLPAGFASYKK